MGGAEKALVSLLKALDPDRYETTLFLFENGGVLQSEVPEYVHIMIADPVTRGMTLEMRNYLPDVIKTGHLLAAFDRFWITMNSKLHRNQFSWNIIKKHISKVQGHYDVAVGFLEGFTDFFVIDKIDADRKIGWIHTDMTNQTMSEDEVHYYAGFDRVATISEICKEAFIKNCPSMSQKTRVIENIVLPEEVHKRAGESVEIDWNMKLPQLVSVGRLEYPKGFDIAVKAADELRNKGIEFCWHVFGQGNMKEEIQKYITEHSLEDYFILEGMVTNPYPYMLAANLIVQPSWREGKSIVLDEAKILAKPIVVTNYPSVDDQIVDGKTGIIVGMEPEQIADGIQRLLNDKTLQQTLKENCSLEMNGSIKALEKFYQMIETI